MRFAVPLVRMAATSASGSATTTSLKVGDALRSGRRRFTEADGAAYAPVSGDRNPVHLDDAFARGAGGFARGRVVHGMLAASLFPALIATLPLRPEPCTRASRSGSRRRCTSATRQSRRCGRSTSNPAAGGTSSSSPPSASPMAMKTTRRPSWRSMARQWCSCPRCSSAPRPLLSNKEMSYDIKDIIDDFMCKIGKKNKQSGFVHDTIQRLKTSRARHQIAGQIEEIKKLVRETSERRERYKLDVPRPGNVAVDQRVVTLYENAAKLVGIEGPTNEVVSWLNHEEKQLKVVSIVGFGGLGKTTLANQVYHKLEGGFQCGAFVPVSQKPNMSKLLHSLLTQLGCGQSFHDCELNILLNQVRENLNNKRYLVIIDDLWDVSAWNIIKYAFPENNLGSRLIVTTRIKTLAEACCFGHHENILEMKPLCEEDSRILFFGRIFGSEEACLGQLRDMSVEILKKWVVFHLQSLAYPAY